MSLGRLLFPETPRRMPGHRAIKIVLRAVHTLCAGVLVGAYLLVAGFVVEPYVRERARGLRNLLAVSGLDTFTYWLGNWLGDALILVGGAVCVVFMLAAARMAYRKRLCSSAPTYAQLHAAAQHLFKTIGADAAAKLPPTLGPFRTRSNPTLAKSNPNASLILILTLTRTEP